MGVARTLSRTRLFRRPTHTLASVEHLSYATDVIIVLRKYMEYLIRMVEGAK
jgi:hypothetical protein